MHKLFTIEEIVEEVLLSDVLSNADLLHFGLTCSTMWAVAAPVLWSETDITTDILRHIIPESLPLKGTPETRLRLSRPLTALQWGKLKQYARHVRKLDLEDVTENLSASLEDDEDGEDEDDQALNREFFILGAVLESAPSPLFSKLRTLVLGFQSLATGCLVVLNALASDGLLGLLIDIHYDSELLPDSPMDDKELAAHTMKQITTALQACPGLTEFVLTVADSDFCYSLPTNFPTTLSYLTNLEHLWITLYHSIEGLDIIQAAAVLPRLKTADIQTLHTSPSELRSHTLPSNSFRSLELLTLTMTFLRSGATCADVLEWFSTPPVAHLHFTADVEDSYVTILGKRRDEGGVSS